MLEWAVAIAVLAGGIRLAAPWLERWNPRPVNPVTAEFVDTATPPGVPPGAISVPLLVLLDGTEIRIGVTEAGLRALVSDRLAAAPRIATRAAFGERITRAYLAQGTRFWVVVERPQPGEEMQVVGIYLQ